VGQKVHPTGFRIGIIYDWQSKWFADQGYRHLLQEDLRVRRYIAENLRDAGISRVEIERNANQVTVSIHTAKPGIVIGRGGQKVDELRNKLESLTGKRIRVNIQEIRMPELDAQLVARNIADQLERRVAFRRALKQTVARTMGRGAEGCKAMVAGRLGGTEMSRRESTMDGRVPLHTIRADIDFGQAEAHTTFGRIGVKVWIYKGEKLPEKRQSQEQAAEATPAPAAAPPPEAQASAGAAETATQAPPAAPAPAVEPAPPAEPAPAVEPTPPAEPTPASAEASKAAEPTPPAAEASKAAEPEAPPTSGEEQG
jgi:small subunit ribosomal protein S3